jgi:hypothetical protein
MEKEKSAEETLNGETNDAGAKLKMQKTKAQKKKQKKQRTPENTGQT